MVPMLFQPYARDLARRILGLAPGAILETAAGSGVLPRVLAPQLSPETDYIITDLNQEMLDHARSRQPGLDWRQADALALPFDDGRFDCLACQFGVMFFPDRAQGFAEARRVLRPGGRLAFSVWEGQDVASALTYVFEAAEQYGDPALALPPGPGPSDFAVRSFAIPALEEAGFSRINFDYVPSVWTVDDPGAPYDHFLEGTVRGAALLGRQPEANAAAIRAAVAARVRAELGEEGPWTVPLPSVVISATAI